MIDFSSTLVIDDDEGDRVLFATKGCDTASDLKEAIQKMRAKRYELVLLDVNLVHIQCDQSHVEMLKVWGVPVKLMSGVPGEDILDKGELLT